jgi:hypothetical protein
MHNVRQYQGLNPVVACSGSKSRLRCVLHAKPTKDGFKPKGYYVN